MSRLGSTFVSEDTDVRGQPGVDGVDGLVASVVAGTNIDNIDNTDPANPIINAATQSTSLPTTTKGDLIVHNGSVDVRLPVGAVNGDVLTVDSAEAGGLKYATPAAGGGSPVIIFHPTATAIHGFAAISNAAQGMAVNCTANLTIHTLVFYTGTDNAATYNAMIVEVSGASDTIDAVLVTTFTTAALTVTASRANSFTFDAGIPLVAGKSYAFLLVRKDGTGTSVCKLGFNSLNYSDTNLQYRSLCVLASNNPVVSDILRFDTTSATNMDISYTLD